MPIIEPKTIKNIVRTNFDSSSELYERFEKKFGLFRYLTLELAENCTIRPGMTVCDIGCGTGTSTIILSKLVGKEGSVTGIDISENMLREAKSQMQTIIETEPMIHAFAQTHFIQCDADSLVEEFVHDFDSILYNASIFLIPEPKNTLTSAFQRLKSGGCLGLNYLIGVYDRPRTDGNETTPSEPELFQRAKTEAKAFAPYGRRINDLWSYPKILEDVGFTKIKQGRLSKRMARDELYSFYSIPAQSAALWPKSEYQRRLENLDALIVYFEEIGIKSFYQDWGWITATKK